MVDVILETRRLFDRLPHRRDAFTEGEYRRALALLGLDREPPARSREHPADDLG